MVFTIPGPGYSSPRGMVHSQQDIYNIYVRCCVQLEHCLRQRFFFRKWQVMNEVAPSRQSSWTSMGVDGGHIIIEVWRCTYLPGFLTRRGLYCKDVKWGCLWKKGWLRVYQSEVGAVRMTSPRRPFFGLPPSFRKARKPWEGRTPRMDQLGWNNNFSENISTVEGTQSKSKTATTSSLPNDELNINSRKNQEIWHVSQTRACEKIHHNGSPQPFKPWDFHEDRPPHPQRNGADAMYRAPFTVIFSNMPFISTFSWSDKIMSTAPMFSIVRLDFLLSSLVLTNIEKDILDPRWSGNGQHMRTQGTCPGQCKLTYSNILLYSDRFQSLY